MKIEIPIEDRFVETVRRLQVVQDALNLVVLAPAAWARLEEGSALMAGLAALEGSAIALALVSMLRELAGRSPAPSRVAWLNLFFGAVLLTEYSFARLAGGKVVSPVLLTAVLSLALAFSRRLRELQKSRRRIAIDEEALRILRSRIRRATFRWSDLASIEERGRDLWMVGKDGRSRHVPLGRYRNADEIRGAVAKGAAESGVPYRSGDAPSGSRAPNSTTSSTA